jgi:hypothetical protein
VDWQPAVNATGKELTDFLINRLKDRAFYVRRCADAIDPARQVVTANQPA